MSARGRRRQQPKKLRDQVVLQDDETQPQHEAHRAQSTRDPADYHARYVNAQHTQPVQPHAQAQTDTQPSSNPSQTCSTLGQHDCQESNTCTWCPGILGVGAKCVSKPTPGGADPCGTTMFMVYVIVGLVLVYVLVNKRKKQS